jgi:hypothetical protein
MGDGKAIHDPAAYERRSKPRPRAEVEAAFDALSDDLRALCEKHGIAEFVYAMGAYVEGVNNITGAVGNVGSAHGALTLSATMYARQQIACIEEARERVREVDRQVRETVARETADDAEDGER